MKRFIGSFVALLIVFVYALMVIIAQPHVVQAAPIVEPVPPPTEGFKGFGEQVQYPASLDELYALIEGRAHGWVFTECSELPTPFFGWQQVKLLERLSVDDEGQGLFIISKSDLASVVAVGGVSYPSDGTLSITENELFLTALKAGMSGDVLVCGMDGFPVLYGDGVQALFDEVR